VNKEIMCLEYPFPSDLRKTLVNRIKGENMPFDLFSEKYLNTHLKSSELYKRAKAVFAGDGATHFVRIMEPFRPYITHALGSKKWDVDGNEYIDYVMGHGALLQGHAYPPVVKAIQEQAGKGLHYGGNHELEVEWAELIRSMVPSAEKVEFFACGQEANLMAIRLSRVFTGRKKILRFSENFHGWADELVWPQTSPGAVTDHVRIVDWDLNQLETELATGKYAILMMEGGGAHMTGQIPFDFDFVREIPGLTRKYGTVWHMDEVVTGFRDSVGGFQGLVNVRPDVTSFGKIIAGGLGAGALVGRDEIMGLLSSRTPADKTVLHSGTWNANPLTAAAGIAALKSLRDGAPQKKANELAAYLRKKGNEVLKRNGVQGRLYGRSITHIYLGPVESEPTEDIFPPTKDPLKIIAGKPQKSRFSQYLLQAGIVLLAGEMFVLSSAHTKEDVEKTVSALEAALPALISDSRGNP
jgi:glutamate-1-semialdehyde 2,1-aminomutase